MMKPVDETRSEAVHNKKAPVRAGRPLGKKVNRKSTDNMTTQEIEPTVDDGGGETKRNKRKSAPNAMKSSGVVGKNVVTPEVEAACGAFVSNAISLGIDGLKKEFADLKAYVPANFDHNTFKANEARNRYKDVVCLDSTRVALTLNVPPDTDYIHANWVKMEGIDKTFIACQGPLDSTIGDFWRMVHQEEVKTILMLCKVEESGKAKCSQYWPLEQGSYQTYGSMFVNNKKVEKEDKFITYTLEVLPEGCSNSTITKIFQMVDWPDRGVPQSGMSVLRLLKLIIAGGPCVVHCSAGIGRTGTIIAVETAIQRLFKGQQVNMKDVVVQLRNQRASSIQTEGQYCFAHLCVLLYISVKIKKHSDSMRTFQDQYGSAALN